VTKATIAEVGILRARRPIPEVISDSTTDETTRNKLAWVLEARRFAADELDIDVGDSYTMYTRLERDTLALVVSAAPKDQLAPVTWWFPIVGRVPYRGFFSLDDALDAEQDLIEEGYDTYVRPTAAFSTLGWFNDPILSTVLRSDDVEVVTTVLHELAHQYLFARGQVGFNESFANFVGRVAAIRFFCTRQGGGPDSVKCIRAQERWRDYQRFSVFIDEFTRELDQIYYYEPGLTFEDKLERREALFASARERFQNEVMPTFESFSFGGFISRPMNNATLMGMVRYYNRLPDFQVLLDEHGGDVTAAMRFLKENLGSVDDAWELIPETGSIQ